MTNLKNSPEDKTFQAVENIEKYITSISISNFQTNIPRINFRKIKLNKFQNFYGNFKSKSIDRIYLDEKFTELNLPIKRVKSIIISEELNINPLRKKKNNEEKPPLIEVETVVEERVQESPLHEQNLIGENTFSVLSNALEEDLANPEQGSILKPKSAGTKDITFNLEAQIIQEDENVLLSPTLPSTEKTKDDIVGSSGKQPDFVWPPVPPDKATKKTKSKKLKKKPYFLMDENKVSNPLEEKSKVIEYKKEADTSNFPWALIQDENPAIEEIFGGGLESELLDTPIYPEKKQEVKLEDQTEILSVQKPEVQKLPFEEKVKDLNQETQNVPFAGEAIYKALIPKVSFTAMPENMINDTLKNINWFSKLLDRFNNLEFGIVVTGKGEKKVGKMFEKSGYKFTPIRIIILGGAVATLGYSAWNYLLPIINSNYSNKLNDKVIVKNLFKTKNIDNNNKVLINEKGKSVHMSELLEEKTFSPITEEERLDLIQMARESLEGRVDPFGQEEVLPREVIQQKIEEQKNAGPPEISINRTQVELIGVISSNNKNLALVNVYNADYIITEEDDKPTRDSKLKTALSMAVPNRLEVSLLDPVDTWYVKQIIKGKSKGEDPVIELVKSDKKFKLKVGQKVLLPEEKLLEEPKAEDEEETSK